VWVTHAGAKGQKIFSAFLFTKRSAFCFLGWSLAILSRYPATGREKTKMPLISRFMMIAAAATLMLAGAGPLRIAQAQADTASTYDLVFMEVMPQDVPKAVALLRTAADEARQGAGNIGFVNLQRYEIPTQFAMVGVWKDHASLLAYQSAQGTQKFLAALAPLLIAPYDERPHAAVWTEPARDRKVLSSHDRNMVIVLTHIDMFAINKPVGLKLLSALYPPSRKQQGNLAFDVLNQSSRLNHFSLFQAWTDLTAFNDYVEESYVRKFRDAEIKIGGSLYDQRIFQVIQ
jgi:quinol monooxygenase YgiN